jgi:two-component system NtrC family sensor kinase
VRLVFADNGPGVPAEIQRRVFEPFFTSKPVGVGTGIGLSYSYGVVESHGGRIVLDDSKEGGARFVIILPLTQEAKALKAPEQPETLDTEPHSVLIVDDEPEIADMLAEMLRREGHRIAIAASGNEALRHLARSDYDVILSDLKMPDLDGKGLFDRLQRSYPHLADRVVFITGDTLSLGGSGFQSPNHRPVIEKPFVPDAVIRVVGKVLKQG